MHTKFLFALRLTYFGSVLPSSHRCRHLIDKRAKKKKTIYSLILPLLPVLFFAVCLPRVVCIESIESLSYSFVWHKRPMPRGSVYHLNCTKAEYCHFYCRIAFAPPVFSVALVAAAVSLFRSRYFIFIFSPFIIFVCQLCRGCCGEFEIRYRLPCKPLVPFHSFSSLVRCSSLRELLPNVCVCLLLCTGKEKEFLENCHYCKFPFAVHF